MCFSIYNPDNMHNEKENNNFMPKLESKFLVKYETLNFM